MSHKIENWCKRHNDIDFHSQSIFENTQNIAIAVCCRMLRDGGGAGGGW